MTRLEAARLAAEAEAKQAAYVADRALVRAATLARYAATAINPAAKETNKNG